MQSSCFDWPSRLKNSKLLLVENLWIWKRLIQLSKPWGSNYLLAHHEAVSLLSVVLLLTLYVSNCVPTLSRHALPHYAWAWVPFGWLLSLHLVFAHGTWAFDPRDVTLAIGVIQDIHVNLVRKDLVLFCVASHHHVGLMRTTAVHYNVVVVLFDYRDASVVISHMTHFVVALVPLVLCVVLLSWNDCSTQNLWILDFNLRIIKDVIIVINVFYNLDGLLGLFLWLGRPVSSLVDSAARCLVAHRMWIAHLLASLLLLILLVRHTLVHLNSTFIFLLSHSLASFLMRFLNCVFLLIYNLV